MAKGYISDTLGSNRIVSHGKIENLTHGFSLAPFNIPFSIYIRPIGSSDETDIVIGARLFQDDIVSEVPVGLNEWTPLAIAEIPEDGIDIWNYDVYWGAGAYVNLLECDYFTRLIYEYYHESMSNGMTFDEFKEEVNESLFDHYGFPEKQIEKFWASFNPDAHQLDEDEQGGESDAN